MRDTSIEPRVIGTVRNDLHDAKSHDWTEVVSEIVLDPEVAPGLDGLEGFSHIVVLFWLDKVTPQERQVLKAHPHKRKDLPLVGVFAIRTPSRPNPIGVTIARLLERRDNVLKVKGLDAIDGTPVLDIKPFMPGAVPRGELKTPDWVAKLTSP